MFVIAKKNYRESKQEYLPNLLKQNSELSSLYYDRKTPKYKIVAVFFVNDACTAVDQNGLLHRILKHVGVPLCFCKVLFLCFKSGQLHSGCCFFRGAINKEQQHCRQLAVWTNYFLHFTPNVLHNVVKQLV